MKTKSKHSPLALFRFLVLALSGLMIPEGNAQTLPPPPGLVLPAPPSAAPRVQVFNYSPMDLFLYKKANNGDWQFVERVPKHSFAPGAGDGKKMHAAKWHDSWCFAANLNGVITTVTQIDIFQKEKNIHVLSAAIGIEKPKVSVLNYSETNLLLYKKPPGGNWQFIKNVENYKWAGPGNGKEVFAAVAGETWGFALAAPNGAGSSPTMRHQIVIKAGWYELNAFVDIDSEKVSVWNTSNGPLLLYQKAANTNDWKFFKSLPSDVPGGFNNGERIINTKVGDSWCLAKQQGNNINIVSQVTITAGGQNKLYSN